MVIFPNVLKLVFSWIPSGLVIPILAMFSVFVVLSVFRIVKIILDSLPFL